eukprot:224332-Pelagomonas_calceolata.AAC.1
MQKSDGPRMQSKALRVWYHQHRLSFVRIEVEAPWCISAHGLSSHHPPNQKPLPDAGSQDRAVLSLSLSASFQRPPSLSPFALPPAKTCPGMKCKAKGEQE